MAPTTPTHAAASRPPASPGPSPVAPSAGPVAPLASPTPVPLPSLAPTTAPSVATLPAATLSGTVRLPAGIVANNGAGIIANNGAGYRLQSLAQAPLAGVTVALLDAQRQPVTGPGGPLTAVTDASGRYSFSAALPAHNLIVQVGLGTKGAVQAVVPPGAKSVDADLVSTLTTGYILDQYVGTQPDPIKTLDKLPADVEAATRAKTATALTAVPDDLTSAKVVATVASLRKQDAALDQQLTTVRNLLIPAGQSDLGNGQLALDVNLSAVQGIAQGPDGSLYLCCRDDFLVWQVTPDGHIKRLDLTSDGQPSSPRLPDFLPGEIALDGQGRLLIPGSDHIFRRELDGSVAAVPVKGGWPEGEQVLAVQPRDDDKLLVVTNLAVWTLAPDGTRTVLASQPGQPNATSYFRYGWDASGIYLGSAFEIDRLDPTTFVATKVLEANKNGIGNLDLDPNGNVFTLSGADKDLVVVTAAGERRTLMPKAGFNLSNNQGAYLAKDGSAFVYHDGAVYRLQDGKATAVAGKTGAATGDANGISLDPGGLAVGADGSLYATDTSKAQILKITPDKQSHLYAGSGTRASTGDGGPALQAAFSAPGTLHLDGAGNLYVQDGKAIRKIDVGGTITQAFDAGAAALWDFAVAADGTLYVCTSDGVQATVKRVGATEAIDTQALPILSPDSADTTFTTYEILAVGPDGALYLAGGGKLRRWTAAGGLTTVGTGGSFVTYNRPVPNLAIDARGRAYLTPLVGGIVQYDPATQQQRVIAGQGGAYFSGSGVDDGLAGPLEPTLAPNGDLYFCDAGNRQIKRVPATGL